MPKEDWLKLDLFHSDFLSKLVKGLWLYICRHYEIEAEMPKTKVVFMTDRVFKKFRKLKRVDLSKSVEEEYGRQLNLDKVHMLYFGPLNLKPFGDKTCHIIGIRKSRLQRARRFLIKKFRQDFSMSETLLLGLIHETIHEYEDVTGKTCMNHRRATITEDEKRIFMAFKRNHPEYFQEQSERNMFKFLRKVPDR